MTNLECVLAILAGHREARKWSDEAVANDLLRQLDIDPAGEAKKATPVADPNLVTEAEVVAAETAAKEATGKAKAARDALQAQNHAEAHTGDDQTKADADKAMREAAIEASARAPGDWRAPAEPVPAFVPPVAHAEAVPYVEPEPKPLLPAEPVPTHG